MTRLDMLQLEMAVFMPLNHLSERDIQAYMLCLKRYLLSTLLKGDQSRHRE
ncbi:MAG: hypothetical protein JWL77_3594 [Chthonomonadaceae bacterium]|nr:hypothetical protein [Chthonomonadaceae bacterium]